MKYLTLLLLVLTIWGCKKKDTPVEDIDGNKTYTGTILAHDCPNTAFIQVSNGNIGDDWNNNGKINKNVIGIYNCPDSVGIHISFRLMQNNGIASCKPNKPCPAVVYFAEYPKKMLCGYDVKTEK